MQALGGGMVVVLLPVLVPDNGPVQLVHQQVDGSVQVFMGLLHEDVLALDMERDLGLLPTSLLAEILHQQENTDVDHLVIVLQNAVELGAHVLLELPA